jgi:hypothetical protein
MPTTESLPFAIRGLSRHQAIKLSEDRWEYDFGKLAEALEGGTASTKAAKKNRIRCFCDRPPGGDRRTLAVPRLRARFERPLDG